MKGNFNCVEYCKFFNDITINANSKVEIVNNEVIDGPNTDICFNKPGENRIFFLIARNVSIQEFNHSINNFTTSFFWERFLNIKNDLIISKGSIEIGNDVWIGSHCVILSGSKIGHGSIIAANSVVVGEIPPYAIAGGTPAKVIRYRFDEEKIKRLIESNWWDTINELNYEKYANELNNDAGYNLKS